VRFRWIQNCVLRCAIVVGLTYSASWFHAKTLAQQLPDSPTGAASKIEESATVDMLPSWKSGAAKQSVIDFVQRVSTEGSEDFVPASQRVAVFDNDGTLWAEAPIPFQAAFVFDELKRRAPQESQLAANPMVQAALAGDIKKLLAGKHHDGLLELLSLTHAGMTTDEFDQQVKDWLASAKHPKFDRLYSELTYQPMLELLDYLRANGFKTFIVSGGGADFMRVWTEGVYGIPPENVVGSTAQTKYEVSDGKPVLVKTLDHFFVDDKEGKPVAIHQFIGRRPIACFGNSDGDQAMLEFTTIGNPNPSFGLIVHHTDAEREYAYDSNPPSSGRLTTALEAAKVHGWTVVSMKDDWSKIWSEPLDTANDEPAKMLAGKWLAEDLMGQGVIDRAQSTFEISANGEVTGNAAVNRFNSQAEIKGNKIKFRPFAMTKRAGPPALMTQESRFVSVLNNAAGFRIDNNGLMFLTDASGKEIARFTRMEKDQ
jgi:heat shock protein HslJ/phosphoglycolate phosphatase-like HAD superfamily hydrolase